MNYKLFVTAIAILISYNTNSQSFIVGYNNVPYILSNWNETHSNAVIINGRVYNSFTAWQSGFSSFNIKKSDLNGNVISWRKEDSIMTKGAPAKLFTGNNLIYYICKNQITVFDTSLAVKFINTYTTSIPNNYLYFNDGLVASNGDIVLVGTSATYTGSSFSDMKALAVRINSVTGNIIFSKTYDNLTQNIATSVVQNTANASLFISGRVINSGYSTFLLNITNDNLGNLNSSKYFTPANSNSKNIDVRKMIIQNSNLYLFGSDSASKLVVTKTNLNLTSTFQTSYFTNFIYQDATKMSTNGGFYVNGYGPRTYTSVPLSIIQLDTVLTSNKSVVFPNIINKYDSLSNFSIDYYNGLNGAYSNFGANVFEKNGSVYSLSSKSNLNATPGLGNINQYLVKDLTTLNGSCLNNFNLTTLNYAYNIAPTSFSANALSVNSFSQSTVFAATIPTLAITCGTAFITGVSKVEAVAPYVYANEKTIYFQNGDFSNTLFELYNLAGQKIYSTKLINNQKQVEINKLSSGIYFYKLYYNSEIYTKKIVLE
ncbi:MAG: T9SS type A sorting domain-containing protein [Bacteroidota bacterium]|nr:T9SS type A sorting domain-containing protein [Bacteroidota bacterium]